MQGFWVGRAAPAPPKILTSLGLPTLETKEAEKNPVVALKTLKINSQ